MSVTRRQAILAGLGTIVLTGCGKTVGARSGYRRPIAWDQGSYPAGAIDRGTYTPVHPPYKQPGTTHTAKAPQPVKIAGITAIARSGWTRKGPIGSKVNPMKRVNKITIHHEGWEAVYFTNKSDTAHRIEKIRNYHVANRKWGDIGYHYIVDRAGRVWQGRPIQYQGAHVKYNNENNLGILVLGNFDKQTPSQAQLNALFNTTAQLKKQYKIKPALVRSHQEIRATGCPGKNLQRRMNSLRQHVG